MVTTQEEMATCYRNYYSKLYAKSADNPRTKEARELFIGNFQDKILEYRKCFLARPMTEGELFIIVEELVKGKAFSSNGIVAKKISKDVVGD